MSLPGCAPVFSELQSARTVGKKNIELSPHYSSTSFSSDGNTDGVQNHLGLQIGYGLSDKFDIRARYERIWLKDMGDADGGLGEGVDIFAIGPKYSLVRDRLSVSAPVGRAFGSDYSDSWQLHPTVLWTTPIKPDKFEITLAPKYLITFCEDCDDYVAVNLGLAISDDLNTWAIRPEYGLLYNPGEDGHYGQFSIGFSYIIKNE